MSMEAVFYTKTSIVIIEKCTEEDLDIHYSLLADKITDTDKNIYINRMQLSVDQGNAFKIGNKAFLYLYVENNKWYGASIFSEEILLLVFLMVSTSAHLGYRKIEFIPHLGMINKIKSMLNSDSIRVYRTNGKNVIIRMDELINKFAKLFKCMGVTYECRS